VTRQATNPVVRDITSRTPPSRRGRTEQLRTVTAQLSLTTAALGRLLSVSGSQSEFVLASADGSTSVHVDVAVSSVPDAELVIGQRGVVLDWSRGTLTLGQNRVSMSRMEVRFLAALMECAPNAASRAHLVSRLWPTDASREADRDKALSVWIFALRRQLETIGIANGILTVRGVGYLLNI
jgi:DNA-binding response OmpR family regulator